MGDPSKHRQLVTRMVLGAVHMMNDKNGSSLSEIVYVLDSLHGNLDRGAITLAIKSAVSKGLLSCRNKRYKIRQGAVTKRKAGSSRNVRRATSSRSYRSSSGVSLSDDDGFNVPVRNFECRASTSQARRNESKYSFQEVESLLSCDHSEYGSDTEYDSESEFESDCASSANSLESRASRREAKSEPARGEAQTRRSTPTENRRLDRKVRKDTKPPKAENASQNEPKVKSVRQPKESKSNEPPKDETVSVLLHPPSTIPKQHSKPIQRVYDLRPRPKKRTHSNDTSTSGILKKDSKKEKGNVKSEVKKNEKTGRTGNSSISNVPSTMYT